MDDYYEILQVSRMADPEVIKAAYNRLAFKHHPDRNPGDASAEKVMKRLNLAWEILGDAAARNEYDTEREDCAASREREAARQAATEKGPRNNASHPSPRCQSKTTEPINIAAVRALLDVIAIILATTGGLIVILGIRATLEVVGKGQHNELKWILPVLAGGGLVITEGFGLKARKLWAASFALWACVMVTLCMGFFLVSNMNTTPPWAIFPFAFLLAADLIFMSVRSQWKKQHPSLR
jgi:uncharacterized membrane protein (DUF2068 family)